ncbi:TPA: hypothetical protein ACK03M_000311 [Staphylococcus aureus]
MESQHTIIAGPQHREFQKEILQTMQVGGAPTQRISKRNSTNNASWGAEPQHREIGFQISTDNGSWGVTTK